MNAALAAGIVDLAGLYLGVGMLFAVAFVVFGVGRIDPAAVKGTVGFRILILPGSALLWPLLARRWASRRRTPPAQHDAHADGARA